MQLPSALCLAFVAALAVTAASARPDFVGQALEPAGRATVQSVVEGNAGDLVLLDGGLAQGFRAGMVAVVERQSTPVARLLIAEATRDRAVGLILGLSSQQTIQTGDRVLRSVLSIS